MTSVCLLSNLHPFVAMIDITEDLSRLMKKPMIKAARRWFMEVPEARYVDVPDTPTIIQALGGTATREGGAGKAIYASVKVRFLARIPVV